MKTGVVVATLLLLVEFGAARRDWLWRNYGDQETQRIEWRVQQIVEPGPAPLVVSLGSSLTQVDESPAVLAAALGVPREQVINLGMSSGTPFDSLILYQMGRAKLRQAKVAVIGLDEMDLSRAFTMNMRDRRWAGWADRWTRRDPQERLGPLLGWVWRTFEAGEPLRYALLFGFQPKARQALYVTPDGRPELRSYESRDVPANEADLQLTKAALEHNWAPSRTRLRQLQELIRLCREDGVEPVVTLPPMWRPWRDLIDRDFPRANAWRDRCVTEIRDATVIDWGTSDRYGLTAYDYLDFAHMSNSGARKYSLLLADELRRRFPQFDWPPPRPAPELPPDHVRE